MTGNKNNKERKWLNLPSFSLIISQIHALNSRKINNFCKECGAQRYKTVPVSCIAKYGSAEFSAGREPIVQREICRRKGSKCHKNVSKHCIATQSPKNAKKNTSKTCFCVVWAEAKSAPLKLQTTNSDVRSCRIYKSLTIYKPLFAFCFTAFSALTLLVGRQELRASDL